MEIYNYQQKKHIGNQKQNTFQLGVYGLKNPLG